LITHDLAVASEVADRIAVMYAGRIVELGPSEEVLQHPQHPYTAGLLGARLSLASRRDRPLPTLPGEPPDPSNHPPGCAFAPRCALAIDRCRTHTPALAPSPRGSATAEAESVVACVRAAEAVAVLETNATWPEQASTADEAIDPIAVECAGVTKSFSLGGWGSRRRTLQALRGVDLRIRPGECVALVGESGSGKSTLLRVLAGLTEPTGGDVTVRSGGRPQMVFQDAGASLTPWLTIGSMIEERLRSEPMSARQRHQRMLQVLAMVGLPPESATARPAQLSGGQRQRVALARAIAVPPPVLLCDEPTSALDVSLAAVALNLLGTLRRELGMAMLFVTHDLAVARLVADRIAVMYLGTIVEDLPADAIERRSRHPYTHSLLASVPGPGRQRAAAMGEPPSPVSPPGGCAFHPRCSSARAGCSARHRQLVALAGDHAVDCVLVESGAA